jgi:hypothetical protein
MYIRLNQEECFHVYKKFFETLQSNDLDNLYRMTAKASSESDCETRELNRTVCLTEVNRGFYYIRLKQY